LADPSKAQQWLIANQENPAVQFLINWITTELQRTIEDVEEIEMIPNDVNGPTEIEIVVTFLDGVTERTTVGLEE
jgi:hypothetical protein